MIDLDVSLPDFGAFGWPLHGLVQGNDLILSNGQSFSLRHTPFNGDNWLLTVPGAPGVSRSPTQAQEDEDNGLLWPVDVLCWDGHVHGMPLSDISQCQEQENFSYVYTEGVGRCWVVGIDNGSGATDTVRVEVGPLQTNEDTPYTTALIPIPDGLSSSRVSNLRAVDATPDGSSVILKSMSGDFFLLELQRDDDQWDFALSHIGAGPGGTWTNTAYSMQDMYYGVQIGAEVTGTEILDGAWRIDEATGTIVPEPVWGAGEYPTKTPRQTFSAVATKLVADTPQPDSGWTLGWVIREGTSRWDGRPGVVGAWLDSDGTLRVMRVEGSIELEVSGDISASASGELYTQNYLPFYEDPVHGEVYISEVWGPWWPDRQNSTASVSVSMHLRTTERSTFRLLLNDAEIDRLELEREWLLETTEPDLYLNGDVYQYSGASMHRISSTLGKGHVVTRLKIDGSDVVSISEDTWIGINGSNGRHANAKSAAIDVSTPAIWTVPDMPPNMGATPGEVSTLRVDQNRERIDGWQIEYSSKLFAFASRVGLTGDWSVKPASCPTGFAPGSERTVPVSAFFSLRGSYSSRTSEVEISHEHGVINWM
ncbi:hypothetical protein [Stutzerimonas nitrititolerans]|uniref:hypothetical protein n=1 Tax=Stutzerimonas nitrititolerans TaxID=2482751 RepID=UPI0028ADC896|nr:hypothetical protein [Stutzerimonas nitrititolerans]